MSHLHTERRLNLRLIAVGLAYLFSPIAFVLYLLNLVLQSVGKRTFSAALPNRQALMIDAATSDTTCDPSNPVMSPSRKSCNA